MHVFPRALEDLDSLLLKATRKDTSASVETMRSKIAVALGALDKYCQLKDFCSNSNQNESSLNFHSVYVFSVSCKPCRQQLWIKERQLPMHTGPLRMVIMKKAMVQGWIPV